MIIKNSEHLIVVDANHPHRSRATESSFDDTILNVCQDIPKDMKAQTFYNDISIKPNSGVKPTKLRTAI